MSDDDVQIFPRHTIIDCFPLGSEQEQVSKELTLSTVSRLHTALVYIRSGNHTALKHLHEEARQDSGLHSDELRLLYAAWVAEEDKAELARELVLEILPYLVVNRRRRVVAHLIRAQAAARLGEWREALEACATAHQLADSPKMAELRVSVLCMWARVAAILDPRVAEARARRAVVLARTSRSLFHAHATLAALIVERLPYEAVEHVRRAQVNAPSLDALEALRILEAEAFRNLRLSSVGVSGKSVDAYVRLRDPSCFHIGLQHYPLAKSPALALLIAFLTEHPETRLVEIAEQLLPDDENGSRRIRHHDEVHRVARVRQLVQRVRALVGDPDVIISRNSRLRLGPGYHWSSDLEAIKQDSSGLPLSLTCSWLVSLLSDDLLM